MQTEKTPAPAAELHSDAMLILDFGSQYSQLIARRIRECGVYCEIYPYDVSEAVIQRLAPKGIILSGGPESVRHHTTPRAAEIIFTLDCPILGICYGMQTLASQLGGKVESADHQEFGYAKLTVNDSESLLLKQIEDAINNAGEAQLDVWMSHGDHVTQLPTGFKIIGHSSNAPIAAMEDSQRRYFGLQFHPEVTHTPQGKRILERFAREICGCRDLWRTENIIDNLIADIKARVGNDQVILGLSGGVDSSVLAALLHQAIGDQLTAIFVDNGLLRLHEAEEVERTFAKHMGIDLHCLDSRERFLTALAGIDDPERKRKIIGHTFIEIFEEEAKKLPQAKWLAQGTIYPDVIESAGTESGKAHVIKSHHNVGGLPEELALDLIEPLRELFKDEVRTLGLALGLPRQMIYRHPFPGPGLAVRMVGEIKAEALETLRQADAIFIDALKQANLYDSVSQAFAVFLPVKSVGVVGDARCHAPVIALRAVETIDFMTARWARLPYDFLDQVSLRIINEVRNISRVVYDISSKPPATIEWE
ncbi:MAG: glutamine-hydrolyzing GMP synthase [Gammaproteobacteria bacterium]|nr:glutamine-hydrolyzing GMP synthase [Gammaproteobacteria bacterium]